MVSSIFLGGNMTAREAIDKLDSFKPNQYSEEDKLSWLSAIEFTIYEDIIYEHEAGRHNCIPKYEAITPENMDKKLIVPFPYDELYVAYLKVKVDEQNQETQRYNVSATLFNSYLENFAKFYNKHHMPKKHPKFHIWG